MLESTINYYIINNYILVIQNVYLTIKLSYYLCYKKVHLQVYNQFMYRNYQSGKTKEKLRGSGREKK